MSAVTKVSSTDLDHDIVRITAMLNIQDMIILAVQQPITITRLLFDGCYSFYLYRPDSYTENLFGNYKSVPDMTIVEPNSFAFIDKGIFLYSNIHLVEIELKKGQVYYKGINSFQTDKHCCGIAFTNSHYFLTYSSTYGYVKMVNLSGTVKTTISTDSQGIHIFSTLLSKIFITSDFKLYVSDIGKNQLSILKVSPIDMVPSLEAEYDNMAANSIIYRQMNELFVAIGGQKNEVVLLSREGPKKIIRQYEILGTPTAICLVGEILYVATSENGWFDNRTHIFGFKDNKNKKREERLISL